MTVQHTHDKFFRESFSRQEIVTSFIEEYLPPEIVAPIRMETLQLASESYVDEELRDHHTDVLYTVQLDTGDEIHLYFLFEHKSFPDREVALQLLRYQVRIWERDKADGAGIRPILPIVIYHGRTAWNIPDDFQALFGVLPDGVSEHLPQFRYLLYDYSLAADTPLRGSIWLMSCLSALRNVFYAHEKDKLKTLITVAFELGKLPNGRQYFTLILYYLTQSNRKLTRDLLEETMQEQGKEGEDLIMTVAEVYRQEGREQGIKQGIKEGIKEGLKEGREQMRKEMEYQVQRMYRLVKILFTIEGKTDDEISDMTGLPIEEVQQIRLEVEKADNVEINDGQSKDA